MRVPDFDIVRQDYEFFHRHRPDATMASITAVINKILAVHDLNQAQLWAIISGPDCGLTDIEIVAKWHLLTDDCDTNGKLEQVFPGRVL